MRSVLLLQYHTLRCRSTSRSGGTLRPLGVRCTGPAPVLASGPEGALWEPVPALPRSLAGPVLPALPACFLPDCVPRRSARSVSGLSGEDSWALDPTYLPSDTPESCGIPQLRACASDGLTGGALYPNVRWRSGVTRRSDCVGYPTLTLCSSTLSVTVYTASGASYQVRVLLCC
jgi:hypothetical protein